MKKTVILEDKGSIKEAILKSIKNIENYTTVYKNTETGSLSTEMPINTMFEIINIFRDEEILSGREKRNKRRKN